MSPAAGRVLPDLLDLTLLHACAERGVKVKLLFERPPEMVTLDSILEGFYLHKSGKGFFRGQLGRWVTITGIPEHNHITLQFSMLFRDRALQDLESYIPGFQDQYDLGLMYLEERKGEAL